MFWSRTVGSYRVAALVAFMVSVAFCACTALLLIKWSEPLLDDFCRASLAVYRHPPRRVLPAHDFQTEQGILYYVIWNYLHWGGRWAAVGFGYLLLSITRLPNSYSWLLFTLLMVQYFLLYVFIWAFVRHVRLTLYITALITSVYWSNMPSIDQGILWATGIVENQLPLTLGLFVFLFALPQPLPSVKPWSMRSRMTAACVLGFVTPAFQELAGGVLVLALSAITASVFWWRSSDRKMWLTLSVATVMGFLIVFVAPGNFIRLNFERMNNAPASYLMFIFTVLRAIWRYVIPWCLDFKHWLVAVVIWFDPGISSVRAKFPGMSSYHAIAGFALVWLSSTIIMLAIPIYSYGGLAGRTVNFIYGVFLIGWIGLAFLLARPHPRFSLHSDYRVTTLSSALVLFSLLVVTSTNTVTSVRDIISGRAKSWNTEMNSRFTTLKTAGRNADVILPPISAHPETLSALGDINEKPDYWSNQCLALYFGISSVQVSTSGN